MGSQPAVEGRGRCGQSYPVLLEGQVRMSTSANFNSRFLGISAANPLLGQMQKPAYVVPKAHIQGVRVEQAEVEPEREPRGCKKQLQQELPSLSVERSPRETGHKTLSPSRRMNQSCVTCLQPMRDPDYQKHGAGKCVSVGQNFLCLP